MGTHASVTAYCPACLRGDRFAAGERVETACDRCGATRGVAWEGRLRDGRLEACVVCGGRELFREKDFPMAAGCAVMLVAAILGPFTYWMSLGVATLIDLLLYYRIRDRVVCYACSTEYRGFANAADVPPYDLVVGQKHAEGRARRTPNSQRPTPNAQRPTTTTDITDAEGESG